MVCFLVHSFSYLTRGREWAGAVDSCALAAVLPSLMTSCHCGNWFHEARSVWSSTAYGLSFLSPVHFIPRLSGYFSPFSSSPGLPSRLNSVSSSDQWKEELLGLRFSPSVLHPSQSLSLSVLVRVLTRFFNLVHVLIFPTYYTNFVIEEDTLNLYFKFNWIWQIFSIYSIPSYSLEFMMGVVTLPCFFSYSFVYVCSFGWFKKGKRAYIHCFPTKPHITYFNKHSILAFIVMLSLSVISLLFFSLTLSSRCGN